jgi:microcystin-dependent protein
MLATDEFGQRVLREWYYRAIINIRSLTRSREGATVDQFLGEIRMFPFDFAPAGWARADGSLLPISQNEALHSLLGDRFGGDGTTNFALPDLRGQVPVISKGAVHYCISVQGIFPHPM